MPENFDPRTKTPDFLRGRKVAVVVPAFNEEKLIRKTLQSLPLWLEHVIVVDDASADKTPARVQEYSRNGLELLRHEKNLGVGQSIWDGYLRAAALNCDIAVVMAGDAQMDPQDLPALLEPILNGSAAYVKGNRFAHVDVKRVMPSLRYWGGRFLALATRLASGYWSVNDPQCGYTAIRRDWIDKLSGERIYPRYGYPNDMLIKLGTLKAPLAEVPVKPVYGEESSGIRIRKVAPVLLFILTKGFFRRIWKCYLFPAKKIQNSQTAPQTGRA